MSAPKVVILTVTYGSRWKFLSRVVSYAMGEEYVTKLIIVDNGSLDQEEMFSGIKPHSDKIDVLRFEKNVGSARGFARGIEYAQKIDADFLFILDDDNIPEEGAIQKFLELRNLFSHEKVVLCGHRVDLPGTEKYFHEPAIRDTSPHGTFFQVFGFRKIINFFRLLIGKEKQNKDLGPFMPVVPIESFAYGGSFIPMEAIRKAPLPDESLVLYGDDNEYSWGINQLGYDLYLCSRPVIHDIDLTFNEGSHLFGFFSPETKPFKVYFHIRNSVRLSRKHSHQWKPFLLVNVILWNMGLCMLGLAKYGPTRHYFSRVKLIFQAVYGGYIKNVTIPDEAKLP